MTAQIKEAKKLRSQAKVQRKRGEALLKANKEAPAKKAFEKGLELLEQANDKLKIFDAEQVAADLAETLGSKAGMLRRLGDKRQPEALDAYKEGAVIEEKYLLASTYNRLNAFKLILSRGMSKLSELEPKIAALADIIEENLRKDQELSDRGWAWADLGDCRALIGELEKAEIAYTTFINRAEIKSPETTLAVMHDLAKKLEKWQDPEARRVRLAVEKLKDALGSEK